MINLSNKLLKQLNQAEKFEQKDTRLINKKLKTFNKKNERVFKTLRARFLPDEVESIRNLKGAKKYYDEFKANKTGFKNLSKDG